MHHRDCHCLPEYPPRFGNRANLRNGSWLPEAAELDSEEAAGAVSPSAAMGCIQSLFESSEEWTIMDDAR